MNFDTEISIVIAGEAGQGIDTITHLISKVIKESGFNVFYTKEYMSRIKGGCNSSTIRISKNKVSAYKQSADFAFCLSEGAIEHLENRLSKDTIIIYEFGNIELIENFYHSIRINFSSLAKTIGSKIYINTLISGIIICFLNIDLEFLKTDLNQNFSKKNKEILQKNLQASEVGYEIGKNIISENDISINIPKDESVKEEKLIDGNDAIALGCIAGGLDFISSYPMSPSTGILTFMAKYSEDFNIIVEQAEDEIAAINMGLGAWYAGGRAMTSTSGGGFSLMCEAVSLAGMTETPMVIYIGQRPGPATGLPTRTEQADLNLALYAGHGEFPRIILTPGNLQDAFYISQKAFNLADKFQVPVFILSDQYLADTCYNTSPFDCENFKVEEFIQETSETYKRYYFSENGIRPRGIPNFGNGLVVVDSDEHDEDGHIIENFDLRTKMVNKRMSKLDLIREEILAPEFFGEINAKNLIVGWGSTCEIIKEALKKIDNPNILFIYFKQIYPLSKAFSGYFKNAKNIICIENNYSGQFANLLKLELDININKKILKYNGLAFSVEELTSKINEVLIEC